MSRKAKVASYEASDVDSLQNVAFIQARPFMFIPDLALAGALSLVKEAWANAVDEWIAGRANKLRVRVLGPLSFQVEDDGCGIPVDVHPKTKQPTLTSIFTMTGTGAKFRDKAYGGISAGLHGVGITAVNALSTKCEVWTVRDGKTHYQAFKRGEPVAKLKQVSENALPSGTRVRAALDPEVFSIKEIPPALVREMCWAIGLLCPGLHVWYYGPDGARENFTSKKGIVGMLEVKAEDAEFDVGPIVVKSDHVDAAFGWKFSQPGETWWSYVNVNPTIDHGIHVTGAVAGVSSVLKSASRGSGLSQTDLLDGLRGVIHARVKSPQFVGQAKNKLAAGEEDVAAQLRDALALATGKYFRKNRKLLRLIIDRAKQLRAQREEYKKALATLRKVDKGKRGQLPAKLATARCAPEKRELFLCEGPSAGGTAIKARNDSYQEVLPLRGKVINAARATLSKLLDNEEIQDILRAVGGGFGKDFNTKAMRVGKILLLADGDADGSHISCLLLALFLRYLRPIVNEGRLYIVQSPLYLAEKGSQRWFGDTLEDVQKKAGPKAIISRLKGHGSANVEDLRSYAMNSDRKLLRISPKGAEAALALLGDDVALRKDLLGLT